MRHRVADNGWHEWMGKTKKTSKNMSFVNASAKDKKVLTFPSPP
jgi:hypothetical protein